MDHREAPPVQIPPSPATGQRSPNPQTPKAVRYEELTAVANLTDIP